MPVAVSTQTQTAQPSAATLKLRTTATDPNHLKQLKEQGFVVVPGIMPVDKARKYVGEANDWLSGFGKGFDINDKSTWHAANLPPHFRGGLYSAMGVAHEDLLWRIRAEPALIQVFTELWGTDELLVSFDGANFSIPLPKEEIQNGGAPWPHVDQSPLKKEMNCIQGIMNLAPNGPQDGGLMVLKGSFQLYKEYIESHDPPEGGWPTRDSYHHPSEHLQWFYDRGCEWIHMDAGEGDLILWDSRTIHYGAAPTGQNGRYATYVCYKPAAMSTPEHLEERAAAIRDSRNMSHDPTCARTVDRFFTDVRTEPSKKHAFDDPKIRKLAGLEAY